MDGILLTCFMVSPFGFGDKCPSSAETLYPITGPRWLIRVSYRQCLNLSIISGQIEIYEERNMAVTHQAYQFLTSYKQR